MARRVSPLRVATLALLVQAGDSASAQNLPNVLIRVANNWSVRFQDIEGTWQQKAGAGKLCSVLRGEKISATSASSYGSHQEITEGSAKFTFKSGSEALLSCYTTDETEWELFRGSVTYSEVAGTQVVARRRFIRNRGTRTSGRVGGKLLATMQGDIEFRVTAFETYTLYECISGVMTVDGVDYEAGQCVCKPYR